MFKRSFAAVGCHGLQRPHAEDFILAPEVARDVVFRVARGAARALTLACAGVIASAFTAHAASPVTPAAAAAVSVKANLSRSAIAASSDRKVYIKIDLTGIAPTAEPDRLPLNVALVLDRSGSMKGAKIHQARRAAKFALDQLGNSDFASLIVYDHDVDVLLPAMRVSGKDEMAGIISRIRPGGRTALHAGVVSGLEQVRRNRAPSRVSRIILLSDGLANVGPSSPDALARLGVKAAGEGVTISTIGLGLGYNEDLMSRLAFASDGNHAFVKHADDLVEIFAQEFGDLRDVVAQDVIIEIELEDGFVPLRGLGREASIKGNKARFRVQQLRGGAEKFALLEVEVPSDVRPGTAPLGKMTSRYRDRTGTMKNLPPQAVSLRVVNDAETAKRSVNEAVMAEVAVQEATAASETAVSLRDAGNVAAARSVLQRSAARLSESARRYKSKRLEQLSSQSRSDAAAISDRGQWTAQRKSLRARQHRAKTSQSY